MTTFNTQAEIDAFAKKFVAGLKTVFSDEELAEWKRTWKPPQTPEWPEEYINRDTQKPYKPHSDAEAAALADNVHRNIAALGGEGGGKSVFGIIRDLERIKAGCSGLMVSPDLPHLKKSLWPEFRRWCPWYMVHDKHQNMAEETWSPYQPFHIVFKTGASLYIGGMDEPGSWEGPNVNFAHFDEARRKKEADALKVLTGRVRIMGPNGELPQLWITTTPRKHWLHTYFSGLDVKCLDCGESSNIEIQSGSPEICGHCGSSNIEATDPQEAFKRDSVVFRLFTRDNEENLQAGFSILRAQSLTEAEARVLLFAEWEDIEEGQPFLPSMLWWDQCRETVPELDDKTPVVIGVDAAMGRQIEDSDCFAIVVVSRHPSDQRNSVMVRYVKTWQARAGHKIDWRGTELNPGPERELLRLCGFKIDDDGVISRNGGGYNVKCIACDPLGLDDLVQRFRRKRVAYMKGVGQTVERIAADTNLLTLIQERRIAHDGDKILREHVQNADRKLDNEGHRLRAVKREKQGKIDALISLSMAAYTCLRLNL
jgi:hypothetical protein